MSKKNITKLPAIRHREHLVTQNENVIEFGGKIELIIAGQYLYIVSPKTLEHTFNYKDHISEKKDENLQVITNMNFVDEYSNMDIFKEKSSKYMLSRKLASITTETLNALEKSFEKRCDELYKIKQNIPNDDEKDTYIKRYDVLWPLFDHIDVKEKKVRINPDKTIEPLLYFFTDKIVESFLTKELKENF